MTKVVPVPSLKEQRRVVVRIQECFSRVEEIERLQTEVADDADSIVGAFLREGLDKLRSEHPEQELDALCNILGGASLPKGRENRVQDNDLLLIKVGDLNLPENDPVVVSSRAYADSGSQKRVWPKGTVVLPKRGGAIATNKKRILGSPAVLDPNLMGLIPDPSVLDHEFLYSFFIAFDLTTITSGSTVPQLNKKDLDPIKIPLPPLDEQKRFADRLLQVQQSAQEILHLEDRPDVAPSSLRNAILRQAFAGEL